MKYEEEVDRFWSRVKVKGPNECWDWTGAKTEDGYGRIRWRGKSISATWVSYELANGSLPLPGLAILHSCDRPVCVNPAHLRQGTIQENNIDTAKRNRMTHQKIRFEDVKFILARLAAGEDAVSIAKDYGCTPRSIRNVRLGNTWSWAAGNKKGNRAKIPRLSAEEFDRIIAPGLRRAKKGKRARKNT